MTNPNVNQRVYVIFVGKQDHLGAETGAGQAVRLIVWGVADGFPLAAGLRAAQYGGIPIRGLRIDSIEWTDERAEHIRTRTKRIGPGEFDIEPEWATEAALDTDTISL